MYCKKYENIYQFNLTFPTVVLTSRNINIQNSFKKYLIEIRVNYVALSVIVVIFLLSFSA